MVARLEAVPSQNPNWRLARGQECPRYMFSNCDMGNFGVEPSGAVRGLYVQGKAGVADRRLAGGYDSNFG